MLDLTPSLERELKKLLACAWCARTGLQAAASLQGASQLHARTPSGQVSNNVVISTLKDGWRCTAAQRETIFKKRTHAHRRTHVHTCTHTLPHACMHKHALNFDLEAVFLNS